MGGAKPIKKTMPSRVSESVPTRNADSSVTATSSGGQSKKKTSGSN